MSRLGIVPVKIEEGVTVNLNNSILEVKGPKGELRVNIPSCLDVKVENNEITLTRKDELKTTRSLHGTIRMIIANTIYGVKNGYEMKLDIVGVGYRAKVSGNGIEISLGYTNPVKVSFPEGIKVEVPEETKLVVKGIDKQVVGQVAARLRALKKPEPYKGKGIRYEGEYVKIKSSKSAVSKK